MAHVRSFKPVAEKFATVLILGSMPGKASLAAGEYYAHPRNLFWTIMGELLGFPSGLRYEERLEMLRSSGIALWDVLQSCVRESSLDTRIEADSEVPNDFNTFFRRYPHITHVFFNGAKAEQCFHKHVRPLLKSNELHYQRLPSTSPANAGIPHEKKRLAWQAVTRIVQRKGIVRP
jgi:TDG/mug DNA glycosylase family protein